MTSASGENIFKLENGLDIALKSIFVRNKVFFMNGSSHCTQQSPPEAFQPGHNDI